MSSCGVPATSTESVNVTVTDTVSPMPYAPSVPASESATDSTVGTDGTLFVTACAAKVAASLPAKSCTALASSLAVGSV